MQEVCYCGRAGQIEDREPVRDGGERALQCPNEACGHVDYLLWLSEGARLRVFEEAERRSTRRKSSAAA